ncbi:DUF2079 domain-containing protein [Desulfobacterota bacterium AH_259_B03_O07]|nr:DUF2079 domain-containing protein [Desulfobacterota bacterium AH_259_B03_O07]
MKKNKILTRIHGDILLWLLGLGGALLIALTALLTLVSPSLDLNVPLEKQPVILVTILLLSSGVVYFLTTLLSRNSSSTKVLLWIIIVGAILRLITLFANPILEDDYFRYLWDGGVLSFGNNPYQYSPEQIVKKSEINSDIPQDLQNLAEESGNTIHNINHPYLRTIYLPIAQAAFAIAHWIKPWSISSWRLVLLIFDVITLLLLYRIIKHLKLPRLSLLIYWWNPLLIKEILNSGHLDVIAFPFVLGALILYLRKKNLWSVFTLSLAIGVKIWPIFIMPLILRPLFSNPKRLFLGVSIFMIALVVFISPFYLTTINEGSGLLAYGRSWQNNDSLFKIFVWFSELILSFLDTHPGHAQFIARIIVVGIIAIWIAYITSKKIDSSLDLFENCLLIVACVFLLIPTQFPWYYTWLIPFLAISPRTSLLLLTVLLPLYYLRYYLEPRGMLDYFNNVIVWIEFVPVWILLIIEWRLKGKKIHPTQIEIEPRSELK